MPELDLNLLRMFLVVSRTGTLSATAAELKLPISSIGRAMTRLEQQCGVLLIQRGPRGITLTDAGSQLLRISKKSLDRIRAVSEAIQDQRSSPAGLLRVTCPVTMAHLILLPILPEFLRRYPNLRLEIKTYSSDWDQEPRETVDVFFKARIPRDSNRRQRLFPDTRVGLFASKSFVDKNGQPESPEDLLRLPCIGATGWQLRRGSQLVTVSPSCKVTVEDPIMFQELILAGVGIGPLPLMMAYQPHINKRLVRVLPDWEPPAISLCALYLGPAYLTPKVDVFLAFVAEFLGTTRDPRLKGLELSDDLVVKHTKTAGSKVSSRARI